MSVGRRAAAAAILVIGLTAAPASASTASQTGADPSAFVSDDEMPAFYTPPEQIPGERGAIIRSEPMTYYGDALHVSELPGTATRMMYTSRDRGGSPLAVTGTVIVPDEPWTGDGERPVIGYAVGTQGLADRCAPSYAGAYGIEYEVVLMRNLLDQGYALAITDYEGLGTPGPHTYMNREVEGKAVIDSVHAARNLPGSTLAADGPVAFVGYSQGGGGAASAAELSRTYAPELDVKGTFAGAVPADLEALVANIDGGFNSMFTGYTVAGMADGYGIDTDPILNDAGEQYLDDVRDSCTLDLPKYGFRPFTSLTTDGESAAELFRQQPFADVVAEQRIGERRPEAPVLVYHSALDEIVPYETGRTLARDWCDLGARVTFKTDLTPGHFPAYVAASPTVNAFLDDVFAGKTTSSSCWRL
ncbi:hypothetical protein ASG73_10125 [Janibacter sp. Soil728]|nr:hypothetical protein ASG73_10125 [Janibacter sp. Soil728]